MKKLFCVLATIVALALPTTAFAQSAANGYSQAPGAQTAGTTNGGGSLPFTGLEIGALALLGTGLIGVGVAMHATRRPWADKG
jgi:hypothetical protein